MIRQSLLARGKYLFSKTLYPRELSPSERFLVQKLVLNSRRQDFCIAADGDQHDHKGDEKGGEEENDKGEAFRKKIDQLRELKRQKEELDKKYESYFTVDYALNLAKKGFQDSEDDEFVDSSDSDHSSLEIMGPSIDELSPDEFSPDDSDYDS